MPSLEDSRRQVNDGLSAAAQDLNHDDILASLQEEIDKHNAAKDDLRETMRRSRHRDDLGDKRKRSTRLRFKDGDQKRRKRKHELRRDHHGRIDKRKNHEYPTRPGEMYEAAHPFPREPTAPDGPDAASGDAAFRDSLFDALADDEGAHYWESVYSQPIHVYARPTKSTPQGELEHMNDEEYAAYVKTKMWEKKHPEEMIERERSERKRRQEEEERTRRREEFIRRKEQAAWERAEKRGARRYAVSDNEDGEEQHEYHFAGEANSAPDVPTYRPKRKEYEDAWAQYLSAWDMLKLELLDERTATSANSKPASQRIPWPVLTSKPVIKANIEAFIRHAPWDADKSRLQMLKLERVRWHPDKVQQRFAGAVDEGTMKLVTGVFQVMDALYEEERAKG